MRTNTFKLIRRVTYLAVSCFLLFLGQVVALPIASAYTSTPVRTLQGTTALCLQPPQNVDLMTLSDTELQLYGLPVHALLNENPQKWTQLLSRAKHRTCGSYPNASRRTRVLSGKYTGMRPDSTCPGYPSPGTMCPNPIWAGNEAQGNRGTYREATIEFRVPTISTSIIGSHVSLWAGVGGDGYVTNSPEVVQAGVDVSVDNNHHQYNESWWEVVPGFAEQNLPLSKGLHIEDDIYVDVTSNLNNNGQDYFFIENLTTVDYNSHSEFSSQYYSDSATGECIVERVTIGSSLAPLAQFSNRGQPTNTVKLYGCAIRAENSSTTVLIGNLTHHYLQIYNDPSNPNNNTLMASVGPIVNGGDYPVTWHRSS